MRRYCATLATALVALVAFEQPLLATVAANGESDSWDYARYYSCTERLFRRPGPEITLHNALVVTLDILDDTCNCQLYITLVQQGSGNPISGRVMLAYPESEPPLAASESIPDAGCPMVRVRLLDKSLLNSNKLLQHVLSLGSIQMPIVPEPVIWLHGIHYTIWISAVWAENEYRFIAPGDERDESDFNKLDSWIRELRRLLRLDCSNLATVNLSTQGEGEGR